MLPTYKSVASPGKETILVIRIRNKRDLLGGCIIAGFGVVGLIEGQRLGTGTLRNMGPGFVLCWLGVILIGLGPLVALSKAESDPESEVAFEVPEWRGWLCITAGVISFILLGAREGLVLASFSSVFISALGDRTTTLKSAFTLGICVTVFGVALFHYALGVSIPLFWW
jgi:hypothetical protein